MARFCEAESIEILGEFVEVETGCKGADALDRRPKLATALSQARKAKCYVVVAKLDRLSRDVAFIAGVIAQRLAFVTCDMGFDVDPTLLHVLAAFSERERRMISIRTKEALQAAKARGKILGNRTNRAEAQTNGRATLIAQADQFALSVAPVIRDIHGSGVRSTRPRHRGGVERAGRAAGASRKVVLLQGSARSCDACPRSRRCRWRHETTRS